MIRSIVLLVLCMVLVHGEPRAASRTFLLNSSYSPPYSTAEQSGYLDLILKEAFSRAGFAVIIQMLPAERALQDANAGVADGDIGRIRRISEYYPHLLIVDEPIIESRDFVAFSIDHSFRTTDWASLKPYHVGIMRGWKILENNVVDTRSLIRIDSTLSLFRLLKNNRVDVVVNARVDGLYAARMLEIDNLKVMEPPLASLELYLFMHEKHRQSIPALEKALKQMKDDGTFYRIRDTVLDRYLR